MYSTALSPIIQVWSWRDRAEELEHLEQTKRTGSPSRDEAMCLNEAEETIEALKQNLAELQESMEKAREDAITSRGVAAEESAKREEAETRLETMEVCLERVVDKSCAYSLNGLATI